MTYEEEYPADESDIRDLVERVRKHPVKKRPDILDVQDWECLCSSREIIQPPQQQPRQH